MKIKDTIIHLLGGYTEKDLNRIGEYRRLCGVIQAYNDINKHISSKESKALHSNTERINNLIKYIKTCVAHYAIVKNSVYGKFIDPNYKQQTK